MVCSNNAFGASAQQQCNARDFYALPEHNSIIMARAVVSCAFAGTLNCRTLSQNVEVLTSDYAVSCNTPTHFAFEIFAYAVIIVWAFGIPLGFCYLVTTKANTVELCGRSVGASVADGLGIEIEEVDEAIRAIVLGKQYGFLLDAFRPSCFLWEPI
eukprot:SAG11_NODE_2621_length_3168_cov_2.076572_2_plen_155_part_01